MKTIEAIYKRKSTRTFLTKKIDRNIVNEILQAGLQAPSPKNDQPWHFLVVEQREIRFEVARILEFQLKEIKQNNDSLGISRPDILGAFESARVLREAPVFIFVYMDDEKCIGHDDSVEWKLSARDSECTHVMAIGAAIQNILLAATEKGVDSLWIGDIFYAYNSLHEYLGVDGCMMALIALGYSRESTSKATRKDFDESVSFFNNFRVKTGATYSQLRVRV